MHRVGSLILLLVLVFAIFNSTGNTMVTAQSDKDIKIKLDNATFLPLTNTNANQLRISIEYDVKNKAIRDSMINGIMKVYSSNGTILKHSSFPNGFLANVSGTLVFKTSFKDPNITDVIANVTIFDLGKKNPLSNTITSKLILQKSSQN
jgi:hypothetical protein